MHIRHENIYPSGRSPVLANNVVATSQPLAAQAGLRMLAKGGNAVDAALASAITLTVVEPTGNGIGSDAFCILWDGNELHGLNASGRAPSAWTPDYFKARGGKIPDRGVDSVTVPGAVSSWMMLSERFGKLDFETLFEPAIGYAENGFMVSPIIASLWQRGAELLSTYPGFAETFMPGGQAPRAGERFVNKGQAESLRLIAESRGEAFYRGVLAEKIVDFFAEHGGALSVDDFATHEAEWCGTISKDLDDNTLHEIPPNGQGIAALMALGILKHTPVRNFGPDDPMAFHYQFEAMKLAFRDTETYVADQPFMATTTPDALLCDSYLQDRARLISEDKAIDFESGAPKHGGTVYVTAADANGMMVSFIQSNYSGFGSGIAVPGTGIHLQNRGFGFTLKEGHPNQVAPGKRPFHTIIPGFLMKGGKPHMSIGVMGGPMQAQGHIQMMLRTQLWGQDVQTAIDAPRWRVNQGLHVACEATLSPNVVEKLRSMGHNITLEALDTAFGFGGAQLIQRLPDRGYIAGSDPRKDGQAVGF